MDRERGSWGGGKREVRGAERGGGGGWMDIERRREGTRRGRSRTLTCYFVMEVISSTLDGQWAVELSIELLVLRCCCMILFIPVVAGAPPESQARSIRGS